MEKGDITMSCGSGHKTGTGKTGNCVCDVLREIARAQRDIRENKCATSCEKSISDLLGETEVTSGLDTVPVILYCKDSCKTFKGYGAVPGNIGTVLSSYYFRVKSVTKDCCAVLELLRDPNDGELNPVDPTEQMTE